MPGNLLVRFDEGVVSRTRREARCCAKDEGRPFGAALWEEASNCRKLLRSKAAVVNVSVKRRGFDHVMYGIERRMQMNLRLRIEMNQDGIQTGVVPLLRERHGRNLLTDHAMSGVQEA
jgi:hypothetical protein